MKSERFDNDSFWFLHYCLGLIILFLYFNAKNSIKKYNENVDLKKRIKINEK